MIDIPEIEKSKNYVCVICGRLLDESEHENYVRYRMTGGPVSAHIVNLYCNYCYGEITRIIHGQCRVKTDGEMNGGITE